MSSIQRRLWVQQRASHDARGNSTIMAASIDGGLDVERLTRSAEQVIARHEILRTRFVPSGDGTQEVIDRVRLPLSMVDVQTVAARCEPVVDEIARTLVFSEFPVDAAPLMRVVLVRVAPDAHVLLLAMNHLISDGWSLSRMVTELAELYEAGCPRMGGPPPQYIDFTLAEREWLASSAFAECRDWWGAQLRGGTPALIPADLAGTPETTGRKHAIEVDGTGVAQLLALGVSCRASLFMVLLSALSVVVQQRCAERSPLVGVITGHRASRTLEGMLGCLTSLALFEAPCAAGTVHDLITEVRTRCLEMLDHPSPPLETAMELTSQPSGRLGIVFVFQPPETAGDKFATLRWRVREIPCHVPAFPITLVATQQDGTLCLTFEYDANLYSSQHVEVIAEHLASVLHGFMLAPADRARSVSSSAATGRRAIAAMSRGPVVSVPDGATLHGLFEAQVARTPRAIALRLGDASIDYVSLNSWANALAERLRVLGLAPEEPVGVLCARSFGLVAAWLGVLKAGGAVAAFDTAETTAEIVGRLGQIGCRFVLGAPGGVEPGRLGAGFVELAVEAARNDSAHRDPPPLRGNRQLAYIVFTSGSSGQSKAVAADHRSMVNRFLWMRRMFPFASSETCAIRSSPAFVDSIWELLGPLCSGTASVIIPEADALDPQRLIATLEHSAVTRIVLVPTMLNRIVCAVAGKRGRLPQLHLWSVSGEPLSDDLAARFFACFPHATLLNLYGSSEVAADVTAGVVPRTRDEPLTAGAVIDNCSVLVLDDELEPCAPFIEGRIFVGGMGLCRGYLADAASTAARFVPHPAAPGQRIFDTGDRGYFTARGALRIAGRLDRQVKRRGVRIHLDDVAARLERVEGVRAAAAVFDANASHMLAVLELRDAATGVAHRHALDGGMEYLELDDDREATMWAGMASTLPATALPDRFAAVRSLPRTQTGKVDHRRLAVLEWPAASRNVAAAPTTTESSLMAICADLVGQYDIRPSDRFLAIGMNSIHMVMLSHRVHDEFSVTLSMASLFRAVSISRCARLIDDEVTRVLEILERRTAKLARPADVGLPDDGISH